MTKDPICGMTVDEATALHAERDGQSFYFCSEHCREKFLAGPEAAKPEANANASNMYTCPMHPEVRQDRPGSCPKCGMALEPMNASAGNDDGNNAELKSMTRRFWIGAALALPVFLLAMAHMIPPLGRQPWISGDVSRWIQFSLTTPVVCWAGWPFFQRGWRSMISWNLNMFTRLSLFAG